MKKHQATVQISIELFRETFFPEGTNVLSVSMAPPDASGRSDVLCVVEHPALPAVKAGARLPVATPIYNQLNPGKTDEVAIVKFVDWGANRT